MEDQAWVGLLLAGTGVLAVCVAYGAGRYQEARRWRAAARGNFPQKVTSYGSVFFALTEHKFVTLAGDARRRDWLNKAGYTMVNTSDLIPRNRFAPDKVAVVVSK